MLLPEFNLQLKELLVEFLWRQWIQLGVHASSSLEDRDGWIIDPEALWLFTANIGGGQDVCRLLYSHFAVALLLTLTAAALAAALGGYRVAQLEPSLALREG